MFCKLSGMTVALGRLNEAPFLSAPPALSPSPFGPNIVPSQQLDDNALDLAAGEQAARAGRRPVPEVDVVAPRLCELVVPVLARARA